ncbi:chemotaxis protein CheW [Piscibacillus salipiscarius]|uniref:Chemotaxis protein CheW n=1 Tax=Piscibacillus salipiscarius TaxID=299480 RepID=A0ABW5QC45_9BACI|nr:chemotaxis protein CheW [Piscibacillus salipiscarius]
MDQFVVFRMREEYYGVPIEQVQAIEKVPDITRVPQAPNYVKGIADIRNEVTTVIDLKELLQVGEVKKDASSRILLINLHGLHLGLMVDEAKEVLGIDTETVEDPPQMVGGIDQEYISAVSKQDDRLLVLVNLEKILNVHQIEEVKEAVEA